MAAMVTSYVEPRHMYRFRGFGNRASADSRSFDQELSALSEGYVWCGTYSEMNDPMEGLYHVGDYVRGQHNWETARSAIRDGKADVGICAFTETPKNELMWAHYASNFGGICVEYDFQLLCSSLPEGTSFTRMSYSDEMPELTDVEGSHEKHVRAVLSTKSYRWAYEREWRLFAKERGPSRYCEPHVVTSVILGPRMDPFAKDRLTGRLGEVESKLVRFE